MTHELKPFGYAPGSYMNNCKSCSQTFMSDKRAWNCEPCAKALSLQAGTRPAAPVERLETLGYVHRGTIGLLLEGAVSKAAIAPTSGGDFKHPVVFGEQAEAIIAAKDAKIEALERMLRISESRADNLTKRLLIVEADNAALTARVKELEETVREDITFAQALETQLAAAKEAHKSLFGDKTMESILWPDVKPTDLITIRVQKQIYDKARTALEAKP